MSHPTKWTKAFLTKLVITVLMLMISLQYLVSVLVFRQSASVIFLRVSNISTVKAFNKSLARTQLSMRDAGAWISSTTSVKPLELCPVISPKLQGFRKANTQVPSWAFLEEQNSEVLPGGRYKPPDCKARHKVAIVIPFRDREIHLKLFLRNIHPFLQRQQLEYGIYVIEMARNITFNRALLMNVGFAEALKRHHYDCFIFHDVDLIPEDDRNLYTCPQSPRHMSVAIDRLKYALPYPQIFGGVSAIPTKDFRKINGFSNIFFGWGGEDDDMYRRIIYSNLTVTRYSPQVARYKMLMHAKDHGNKERFALLRTVKARRATDGLNSLKYSVIKSEDKPLYTWILISVNETEILDSEPIHKIALQNLQKKPVAAGNVGQQKPAQASPNKSASVITVSKVVASVGEKNTNNKVKLQIVKQNANAGAQSKENTKPKTKTGVLEGKTNKNPKVVNWVPAEFHGQIPEHLTKFKPLPKPAVLKRGPVNSNAQVQGLLKAHQKGKNVIAVVKSEVNEKAKIERLNQPVNKEKAVEKM